MNSFVLALALQVTAPAHQPEPAETALFKCFYAQARALDDHISSAAVIAQGVVSACTHEISDWKYEGYRDTQPADARTFYRLLDEDAPRLATEVVLRVRAKH